jgi:hypothetical protein
MRRRLLMVALGVTALAATSVGIAMAQGTRGTVDGSGQTIHLVFGPGQNSKFLDFDHDGLRFGDRLVAVGPLLDESQAKRVGTAYLDCVIVSRVQKGGTYDCTYVLKLEGGDIMTHGIDPQGPSDVFFAVTGGTGTYRDASGQAHHIDTDVTDIVIHLDD